METARIKLAAIGCGGRSRIYLGIAARLPQFYEVVAAADPIPERISMAAKLSRNPNFRSFSNAEELLAQPKLADILIIGTQDNYHVEPCIAAMEKGYDILLEKPIATTIEEVLELDRRARELGRRVLVCHVLRYTPFYVQVKEIVDSGILGEIITVNAVEGVEPWHQAHSFVRGHWAVVEKCTPMIVAKSCHDMDILSWIMDRPCRKIASYGGISHFRSECAPAGAPKRCTDGCPVGLICPYDAHHYLGKHRSWVKFGHPNPEASDAEVLEWIRTTDWGRCVYHCDNTAVDHQVVAMNFEGGATATFTMTAFDSGRNLEIMGTKAVLRGGQHVREQAGCDIIVREHATGAERRYQVATSSGEYGSHWGGDEGLMHALYHEMRLPNPDAMRSSLARSVQSHLMAFGAELACATGRAVEIDQGLRVIG